ncbi:MAG: KamA family radical SAM protein, partial [Spirochaetes bacterium]|nr:KamA family radical SAM protein [Spirochaetota bacterium]
QSLPFAVSPQLLNIASADPADPVLRQFIPDRQELIHLKTEAPDPLGENNHSMLPGLIHQYPSRVLVRANSECAAYCRFCYRRSLQHSRRGFISETEQKNICDYLRTKRTEVTEILVSGGDPLFASNGMIEKLLMGLRQSLPEAIIRLCTRMPIVVPERIDALTARLLADFKPLLVVLHCNHPAELASAQMAAIRQLQNAGVQLISQTVLLRDINDSAEILERLFTSLIRLGVQPYYLFQGDLASGTAHFRVPLSAGLSLYSELRKRLSGLALPRFAVDAPGGKGKMYLPEDIVKKTAEGWLLRNAFGHEAIYPEES